MQRRSVRLVAALSIVFVLLSTLPDLGVLRASTPEPIKAGTTRKDEKGIEQVWVPAGCFKMGTEAPAGFAGLEPPSWAKTEAASEQPAREVCLSQGYWIDKYEVTNAAFQAFVAEGGYEKKEYWTKFSLPWLEENVKFQKLPLKCVSDAADQPRLCITWYEADAYARWRGGKLPTEAEWEFAARGPESRIFPWGNTWDEKKANVVGTTAPKPVGSFPDGASWVGANDMSGNAMEWVSDWLDVNYYKTAPRDDPQGPESGTRKVEKGGWWGAVPFVARAAYRHFEDPPAYQDKHIGVRVVTPAKP